MKKYLHIFQIIILVLALCFFAACVTPNDDGDKEPEDFVSQLTLEMTSSTLKQEVTVKNFIDGDTTHFFIPTSVIPQGVLKARYIAINTPESTSTIEPWGYAASRFTKTKLQTAQSIIVESNDGNWNLDSSNSRHMVWVWYRTSEDAPYRNLNLEILQEGLAVASSVGSSRYGEICQKAILQARSLKYYVYSDEKDPEYPGGTASEITLKELRLNIDKYLAKNVAVTGLITRIANNTAYIESYDEETEMYYGMQVYMGFTTYPFMEMGNIVRIVGTVAEYSSEYGTTYQISNIQYSRLNPNGANSSYAISENNDIIPFEVTAEDFNTKKIIILKSEDDPETTEFNFSDLSIYTHILMKDLKVEDIFTTTNETSSSKGAMTLTCKVGNQTITVRTGVLYDENFNIVTASYFEGCTIDVRGTVDVFNDEPQLKIFSISQVTKH